MSKGAKETEDGLEATESRHLRKYLFWSIVLIFLGAVCLFYSKNPELALISRETWLELLLHVGMAVLISGILVVTVEMISRRFYLKRSEIVTRKLSEDILGTIFEQFTPQEIRDEVMNYIFRSDLYYRDFRVDAVAEEVSVNGRSLLKLLLTTEFEVHNPTSEAKSRTTPFTLVDIDTVEDLPKPIVNSVEIRDEQNRVIEIYKADALDGDFVREGRPGEICVRVPWVVPAHGHVILRKSDTVFLRREKDYLAQTISKPTVNMRLSFRFPSAGYKFWCIANRPGSEEQNRFNVRIYESENRIEAEAYGGLFPFQGLTIQYIHTEE